MQPQASARRQAALDQAKGQLGHAQAVSADAKVELARAEKLLAAHAISEQEYETRLANQRQAQADVLTSRGNVETAALNLGFTRIVSPVAGRVSDHRLAVGNLVTQDQTVLTNVVDLDPIWFSFYGAESLYLKYERAAQAGERPSSRHFPNPVEIRLQDQPNYAIRGRMNFVDNALDPGSGTIRGRALVTNPAHVLAPPPRLEQVAQVMVEEANKDPDVSGAYTTFNTKTPRVFADIDRAKAEYYGVSAPAVFDTLQTYLGSTYINDFNYLNHTYEVFAQADAPYRQDISEIQQLQTRSSSGAMMPLGAVVNIRRTTGPYRVLRYQLYPAAEVQANTPPGHSTGQTIKAMEKIAARCPAVITSNGPSSPTSSNRPAIPRRWSSCWRSCWCSCCWPRSTRA